MTICFPSDHAERGEQKAEEKGKGRLIVQGTQMNGSEVYPRLVSMSHPE